ncbi:MAG: porin family protein [Mesorhizobium sp.]|uniref:outer membrane protein n=1 Tax=Mesorhizobium sp. TaxID=1871066 RepID=UPI001AC2C975|nr:outer membrane beta-barrel protein [Mesorhizobium sp.]MBN9219297.1 porin family protein [Mesorhizobium sp.]
MKRLIALVFALALPAANASAADISAAPVQQAYDWSGVYIGVQGGYGWGRGDWRDNVGYSTANDDVSPRGGLGGIHAGYNWQSGMWVLGIEGSWSYADISRTEQTPSGSSTRETRFRDIATLTGRVGAAVGDTSFLYLRGGYANARINTHSLNTFGTSSDQGSRRSGYVIGVGWDYAFAPNWIAGLEFDHMDFGSKFLGSEFNTGPCTGCGSNIDASLSTVTARVSYKF